MSFCGSKINIFAKKECAWNYSIIRYKPIYLLVHIQLNVCNKLWVKGLGWVGTSPNFRYGGLACDKKNGPNQI